jgi:hypothetical protein
MTMDHELVILYIFLLCASKEISDYYIIETVDSLNWICDCCNDHNHINNLQDWRKKVKMVRIFMSTLIYMDDAIYCLFSEIDCLV